MKVGVYCYHRLLIITIKLKPPMMQINSDVPPNTPMLAAIWIFYIS